MSGTPLSMQEGVADTLKTSAARKIMSVKGCPGQIAVIESVDFDSVEKFTHRDLGIRPYGAIDMKDWQMYTAFNHRGCVVTIYEKV